MTPPKSPPQPAVSVEQCEGDNQIALYALAKCKELCDVAFPQFDWSASALSSDAIVLLNTVPAEIDRAISALSATPTTVEEPKV